jgi:Ca2+-binding RTX toxin-like protein
MDMGRSKGNAGTSRRGRHVLRPCAETLEGRRLLAAGAAHVGIREVTSKGAVDLIITGTNKADVITINDNGTGSPGNITVTLGNGSTYTSQGAVSTIEVSGRGGNDQVTYNLTGELVVPRSVLVDLGAGNDTFVGNVAGAINNPTGLDLEAYGDSGNDSLSIVQSAPTLQGTFFPYLEGDGGNDTLNFQSTSDISAGANIGPGLSGGSGNDTITSNYSGVVDGNYIYNLTASGGAGNDIINDTVNVAAGSTGTIGSSSSTPAVVEGGGGNDQITFAVNVDPTATQVQVNAVAVGGPGKDVVKRTTNVLSDPSNESDLILG